MSKAMFSKAMAFALNTHNSTAADRNERNATMVGNRSSKPLQKRHELAIDVVLALLLGPMAAARQDDALRQLRHELPEIRNELLDAGEFVDEVLVSRHEQRGYL